MWQLANIGISGIDKQQKHPKTRLISCGFIVVDPRSNLNPCLVTSAKHDIVNLHKDDLTQIEMVK